jgi:hypothetical protein
MNRVVAVVSSLLGIAVLGYAGFLIAMQLLTDLVVSGFTNIPPEAYGR